jgi:hypothetical protein
MDTTSTSPFWQNAQEKVKNKREAEAREQQEAKRQRDVYQKQQAAYELQQKHHHQQQQVQQRQQEAETHEQHEADEKAERQREDDAYQEQQATYELLQKRQQALTGTMPGIELGVRSALDGDSNLQSEQQNRRLNELDNERLAEHSTAKAEMSDNKKKAKVVDPSIAMAIVSTNKAYAVKIAHTNEIATTNKFESLCVKLNKYFPYEFDDLHKSMIRKNLDMFTRQEEYLFTWMNYINSPDRGNKFERCSNAGLALFVACVKDDSLRFLESDFNLAKCEEWLKNQDDNEDDDNIIPPPRPWIRIEDGAHNNGYSTRENALTIFTTSENALAIAATNENALTIATTSENALAIATTSENALAIATTNENAMEVSTSENIAPYATAAAAEVQSSPPSKPPPAASPNKEREYNIDRTTFPVVRGDARKERLLRERSGRTVDVGEQRDKRLNTQTNNSRKKRNDKFAKNRNKNNSTTSTPEAVVGTQRRSSRRLEAQKEKSKSEGIDIPQIE